MKCPKCKKPIKENTDGNNNFCQGHGFAKKGNTIKKSLLAITLLSSILLTSPAFSAANDSPLKQANAAKTLQLKAIKAEIKKLKEVETVAKLEEKSKKLDEQLSAAKAKLAEMKATVATK